jgi:metal-sulfur cluster biosynthetic enzyme
MENVPQWASQALAHVYDPCCREKGISVVDMGLLRSATLSGRKAKVELVLTSGWCPFASRVLSDVQEAVEAVPDIDQADVQIVWDEPWTTDRLSESATRKLRFLPSPLTVTDRDAYVAAQTQTQETS